MFVMRKLSVKSRVYALLVMLLFFLPGAVTFAQINEVPRTLVSFSEEELVELGRNSRVIAAVEAQNALGRSLDQIKQFDEEWQNAGSVTRFMLDLSDRIR